MWRHQNKLRVRRKTKIKSLQSLKREGSWRGKMKAVFCFSFSQKGIGKIQCRKINQDRRRVGWSESYIIIMGCQFFSAIVPYNFTS